MQRGTKLIVICYKQYLFSLFITLFFMGSLNAKEDPEEVSLQLQWLDQFQFAGYYMAKEKGFYKAAGLDVTIKPYDNTITPVDEVINNNATYGTGRSTLLIDKSTGTNITLLAAIFQSSPLVLIGLKRDDLNSTSDFKGKRLMSLPDTTSTAAMQAMLASHGISFSDMVAQQHSLNLDDLIDGHTDLMVSYLSNEPYTLEKRGYDYTIFDPKKHGFDFYGDLLFTSEAEAYNHPERTDRFLKASLKGWEYAFSHIDESAKYIFERYNSQKKSLEALKFEGEVLKKLAYKNGVALGSIEPDKLQNIFDIYKVMHLHKEDISVNDILFSKNKIKFNNSEISYINKTKTINVCMDLDFPPYTLEKENHFSGISINFFNLLSQKTGLSFNYVPISNRTKGASYIKNNRCKLIPHLSSHKTSHPLAQPTRQYLQDHIAMVNTVNSPYINNLSDMKNKKIAIISGLEYIASVIEQRYPHVEFIKIVNPKVAFNKLRDGEIDGFLGPYRFLSYAIQQSYIGDLKIALKLESPIMKMSIGVARNNPMLLAILNKALRSITLDEKQTVYQRWLTINNFEKTDYTFIIQLMGIMSLILAIFLYRQSLLKKKNTELKQLQNELEALNRLLEIKVSETVNELRKKDQTMMQQSRLAQLGEMISMIAHQWRQPLAAISSTVASVKLKSALNKFDLSKTDEQEAYKHYLNDSFEQIETYVSTLSNTIDDFRNFYKSEKISTTFLVNDTLEKTLKIIESALTTDNITLVKKFHSKKSIKMYENELLQVFLNLIKNAQDNYKDNATKNATLIISTSDTSDGIKIEICDNGGGIDESIHNQIYDPYFSTKSKKNGTGLGLYMSKMIIEEHHHGKLTHYNKDDGVCFSVMIPKNQ